MLTLIVEGNGGTELTYELTKQLISIGASSENDVVIRSPGVAPRHLVIQRNGDVVTFLGQNRQMVALDGERRSRGVIRPGDRIRIGAATITLKAVDAEDAGSVPAKTKGVAEKTAEPRVAKKKVESASRRSEVVLYSEPHRLAEARGLVVEILRDAVGNDLVPALEAFFAKFFAGRQVVLAELDRNGELRPLVAQGQDDLPKLPSRTFAELGAEGAVRAPAPRFAADFDVPHRPPRRRRAGVPAGGDLR